MMISFPSGMKYSKISKDQEYLGQLKLHIFLLIMEQAIIMVQTQQQKDEENMINDKFMKRK